MIEIQNIKQHIFSVLKNAKKSNVIIAVSGGIDSAIALHLLKNTIPLKQIYVLHLYYFKDSIKRFYAVIDPINFPKEHVLLYSIKDQVDSIANELQIEKRDSFLHGNDVGLYGKIRVGNIMARTRMTYLFDQAKKLDALVCGTENRTEHYLGYFTRFGDAASDFEIINHLYKTQIRILAKYLHVSQEIIDAVPSAGFWEGQTDECELGFSYDEIDHVLHGYFDHKRSPQELIRAGHKNTREILEIVTKNRFKHEVPYVME